VSYTIFDLLKLFLTFSTVPNTVLDLVPKIDKLSADVSELPNEIGAYSAALEENLGKNVEKFIKEMYQVNFFFHDELVKAFNAQTHLGRV